MELMSVVGEPLLAAPEFKPWTNRLAVHLGERKKVVVGNKLVRWKTSKCPVVNPRAKKMEGSQKGEDKHCPWLMSVTNAALNELEKMKKEGNNMMDPKWSMTGSELIQQHVLSQINAEKQKHSLSLLQWPQPQIDYSRRTAFESDLENKKMSLRKLGMEMSGTPPCQGAKGLPPPFYHLPTIQANHPFRQPVLMGFIPTIHPLGTHRVEGGARVLNGLGVNHANLIQVIGKPACSQQPRIAGSSFQ